MPAGWTTAGATRSCPTTPSPTGSTSGGGGWGAVAWLLQGLLNASARGAVGSDWHVPPCGQRHAVHVAPAEPCSAASIPARLGDHVSKKVAWIISFGIHATSAVNPHSCHLCFSAGAGRPREPEGLDCGARAPALRLLQQWWAGLASLDYHSD